METEAVFQTTRIPFKRTIVLRQTGFGLAEIMVGMAIGLITTLVIVQVMGLFEGQKRSTSGSSDAQSSGGLAMYTLQRQLQQAGYGMPINSTQNTSMKCDPASTVNNDTGATNVSVSPIEITDGGTSGGSDTVTVRYGDSAMGGVPIKISSVTGNIIGITNNFGCSVNDIALVSSGSSCRMSKVTAVDAGHTQVTVTTGTNMAAGAMLSCMGNWTTTAYSVSADGNLLANGQPMAAGIVNIQAQYGVSSTPGNNTVTAWVDATGTWAPASISLTDRNRIKAVRVAVVARNTQFEKQNVTNACSSQTLAAPTGLCTWEGSTASPAPKIDLTADTKWQRYRYRVFETIIPLRNVIWSKGVLPP